MKKRLGALLTALAAILVLLTGCASRGTALLPELSLVTAPAVTPEPIPTPFPEPYAGTKIDEGFRQLDYLPASGTVDGRLWRDALWILARSVQGSAEGGEFRLLTYDPVTGEQLGDFPLPGEATDPEFRLFEDGTLTVSDWNRLFVLSDPREAPTLLLPTEEMWRPVMTPDAYYTQRDGMAYRCSYAGGEPVALTPVSENESLCGADLSHLYVELMSGEEAALFSVALDSGERTRYDVTPGDVEFLNGAAYYQPYHAASVRELHGDSRTVLESGLDGEILRTVRGDFLSTTVSGWVGDEHWTQMRVYRLSTGELLFRTDADWMLSGEWPCVVDLNEDGSLALVAAENTSGPFESNTYYLLETENWTPIPFEPDPALDVPNYVKTLEEQFGIAIRTGDEILESPKTIYTLTPESDPDVTSLALKILHETLEKFPEGFFRDLTAEETESDITEVRFLLAAKIVGNGEGAANNIVGYTSHDENDSTLYIALDIRDTLNLEHTIAHELMHAMEEKLSLRGIYFEDWRSFLPEGVEYFFAYVNPDGSDYADENYTAAAFDSENAAFVDAYSKTFPTEDRARIFEHLFKIGDSDVSDEDASLYPFVTETLVAKAKYLCEVIREHFPSVQAVEIAHWERMFRY